MITISRHMKRRLPVAAFLVTLLLTSTTSLAAAAESPAVLVASEAATTASSANVGNATDFSGLGSSVTGGCGVAGANEDSPNVVALNVWNTPLNYAAAPTARPIPAADSSVMGAYDNGANCGRWVQVTIGDYCTGTNSGAPNTPFCQNGSWVPDQYNGATMDMVVADSCGDSNAWCRDDPNHVDLSVNSLNQFQLDGSAVGTMYPASWNNRQVSWQYISAPNYTGDISIGFQPGSSPYWTEIAITHLPNGIHGVTYYNGSSWQPASMNTDEGQVWVIEPNSPGGTSYTIQVQDASGNPLQGGRQYTFSLPSSCSASCAAYTLANYSTSAGNGGGGTSLSAPTSLAVTGTTATSASLSWTPAPGAAGYNIDRDGQQVGTTAGTTYTDSGLSPSTAYSYTVEAYGTSGDTSPASSTVSATTQASSSSGGGSSTGPVTSGMAGKCLDDFQDSSANGAIADLYTCNGTAAQNWTVEPDGTIRINGQCLDVTGQGTAEGTPVELWTCNGGANQKWTPDSAGGLVSTQSGECLDDPNWTTNNGTQLDIWDCTGNTNQRWTLP